MIQFFTPLHGDIDQSTPLRAEMMALLGSLRLVLKLSKRHKLPKDCIRIYTDCKNAILPAIKKYQLTARDIFADDSDVKAELRSTYKQISKFATIHHVKSHQSRRVKFENLSPAGKMNEYMHVLAHSIHDEPKPPTYHDIPDFISSISTIPNTTPTPQPIQHQQIIPHLPKAWASFSHPFERITSDCPNSFSKYATGHMVESKISSSFCLTPSQMHRIEWRNFRQVLQSHKKHKRTKIVKMIHNHWPTNHREFKWNRSTTDKCPLCKMKIETRDHIFQCQSAEASTIRKPLIDGIRTFLAPTTSPIFALNIHRILIQYTKGYDTPQVTTHTTDTPHEVKFKNVINEIIANGPQNLLRGLLPTSLLTCQEQYSTSYNTTCKNVQAWTRTFINCLHNIGINLWKNRCEVNAKTNKTQQEQIARIQAHVLLSSIRQRPDRLPAANRNLMNRKRRFFLKSSLRQISAWVGRVKTALAVKIRIDNKGKRDLRRFLYRKITPIDPQKECPDYDSDDTENWIEKYPDENPDFDTWDKIALTSILDRNENIFPLRSSK